MSKDITPYENNGTNTDITLDTNRFDKADGSYSFNGSTSGVRLTNVLPLNSSYSISLWCYFNGADERDILIGDYNLSGAINFNLERHLSNKLRIYYNSPDLYTDADVITPEKWQHIVMIRDKENSKSYLYVDNELIYTYNGDIGDKNPTVPHYIGRDGRTGSTVMNGRIQDVRVYNRAISIAEVDLLYKQNEGNLKLSSLNKGLVLYYKLDEKNGHLIKNYGSSGVNADFKIQAIAYYPFNGNANDGSQSVKHGTVSGATLTDGRLGDANGAYHFDGLSNGSKITTAITPTTVRTISVWYKTSDVSAANMVLIGNTAGQAGLLWARQSTNDWQVYLAYNGINYRFRPVEPLADGEWHHEVLAFNATTTQLNRYRDGVLIATINQDYTNTVTPGTLNIAGNVSTYTSFNGDIDEILIHQHTSNAKDVNVLYQYNRYKDLNDPYRDGKIGKGSFELWGIYGSASYCPCSYIDGGTTCLGIKNQETWTMSMWVKPSNLTGARSRNSMGWYGGNYKGPWMHVTQDLRITVGQGKTTGSNSNHNATITSVCTKGEWNHVVLTYDGDYVKAYANNVKVYEYQIGQYVDNGNGSQRFKVGAQPWDLNETSNSFFDDVRVYNRALTDEEVELLYKQNEGNLKLNSLNKGLETFLKLDKNLKDSSAYENNAALTSGTSNFLPNGKGLLFNDSYITTSKFFIGSKKKFSLSFWAKPFIKRALFSCEASSSFRIDIWGDAFNSNIVSQNGTVYYYYGMPIPLNVMSLITITVDNEVVKYYIDNVLKRTTTMDSVIADSISSYKIALGRSVAGTGHFNGVMKNARLFNRAITQEEVNLIYNTEKNSYENGLMGLYKLDNITGANDLSEFGLNGETVGTTLTTDKDGNADKAYAFNGTSDYIRVLYNAAQAPREGLTVGAWMYRPSWTESTTRSIISKTEAGGYLIQCVSGYLRGFVHANGGYRNPQVALSTLSAGWHSIYLTYDKRYARLWVDGVNVNTVDTGGTYPIAYAASNSLAIGAEATGGATPSGQYFDGSMYDVRIYNRALTETELLAIYNQ